jgi:2-phospho-L-lactate guanylyltransferase
VRLEAYSALVPVKTLTAAKGRLGPHLTSRQRAGLVLDMLQHVIGVLVASRWLQEVIVVSADAGVRASAQRWGARAWPEEQPGHNAALRAAAERLSAGGATAVLTLSADLPLLTVADIHALVERSAHYPVVLAPAHDGQGTNALLLRPPLLLPYLFGEGSLQRYIQAARERSLAYSCYESRGLALDIDTIEDLHRAGLAGRVLTAGPR